VISLGVVSAGCPNACLNLGPVGREWVIDSVTGCCVERLYKTAENRVPGRACTCSCNGPVCAIDQPVGATLGGLPISCGAGCATHITVDLACDGAQ